MDADHRHRAGFELEHHASGFDARAGLSDAVARQVAEAVHARCAGRRVLEVGAGTGEIGAKLARLVGPGYLGLDRSLAMLRRFRERAGDVALIAADAAEPWPLVASSLDAVWMARVAHLLAPDHLRGELTRSLRPGGRVLVGRRVRDDDHVLAVLRRELHERLRERGYQPRSGERRHRAAFGMRLTERHVAARWESLSAPADGLATWRTKPGLSGLDLAVPLKRDILDDVERFARNAWGDDLARPHAGREHYVIEVFERASRAS